MSKAVLEPLLSSPELVEHVEALNRFVAIEHQRRRRFYEEITEDGKCEFINGEVIVQSPATNKHCRIVARTAALLGTWSNLRELGHVVVEKILCQFPRNDYELDIVFFGKTKEALIQDKTLLHPVPDFIVEVLSESTAKHDRGIKFEDYQAHGVGEFWIIDPAAESVEQFILADGRYPAKVQPLKTGIIRSEAIAGFEIPVRAIFDDAENLAAMRQLLA
jgi:Uma2 family endonuclease